MTKTLFAVMTAGIITNISYKQSGEEKWCKGIFDTQDEARERMAHMNEAGHGDYIVEHITVKLPKRIK